MDYMLDFIYLLLNGDYIFMYNNIMLYFYII